MHDSDSDGENSDDYEEDETNLSEDKKRVLKFFDEGTEAELAGIQGCSKKKVLCITELRPLEGWNDLVSYDTIALLFACCKFGLRGLDLLNPDSRTQKQRAF